MSFPFPLNLKILAGPLFALLVIVLPNLSAKGEIVNSMAAVTLWMAIWWMTEAVPLAVTALLPIVLLPVLGIADSKLVASQYMDPIIFLFIGGFLIAFAAERWNLHQRIALKILSIVGSKPSHVLFGVMLTSYFISMWISNTATVMMLISAVMAIVCQIDKQSDQQTISSSKVPTALLIGLAYAATIGGMATLVGTPTNMIFYREYQLHYSAEGGINFFSWFIVCGPLSFIFLLLAFGVLKRMFIKNEKLGFLDRSHFSNEYKKLGKLSYEERVVSIVFVITAVLWFTRSNIDLGSFTFYGWENLFKQKGFLNDSTVAMGMALLLFLIPSKSEKGRFVMSWKEASLIPFDIVLLFGGGFAMAKGIEVSGLGDFIAQRLGFISKVDLWIFILVMCILITIISEFASNVACIQLMLPILMAIQKDMNVSPLVLMFPAALAASLGFMLPVATAPNTIAFGTKRIKVGDMQKAGLLLNIIGIVLITLTALVIL